MAATFRLEISTPDRPILDESVTEAQIPAEEGYLGILPEHAPLLAELGHGVISYTAEGKPETILVHGGFLEVLPSHVRVLAQVAERPSDIDVQRAQASLDRALQRMRIDVGEVDRARASRALKRAEARLAAAKR